MVQAAPLGRGLRYEAGACHLVIDNDLQVSHSNRISFLVGPDTHCAEGIRESGGMCNALED